MAALLLLLLCMPARGWLHSAQPLDDLARDADVIVKARVSDFESTTSFPHRETFSFAARVLAVVKADTLAVSESLKLEHYGLSQSPSYTFSRKPEAFDVALLFLERQEDGSLRVINDAKGILPVLPGNEATGDTGDVGRGMFSELHHVATTTADNHLRARFIAFMGEFAGEDDVEHFKAWSDATQPWIRLSAQLTLARLTMSADHVRHAVEAFPCGLCEVSGYEAFVFSDVFKDVARVSRCGAHGMKEPWVARARLYLPLYRAMLDRALEQEGSPSRGCKGAWMSVKALGTVGTRDDVMRLYRLLDRSRASVRHTALEGIGRILGKPVKRPQITAYPDNDQLPEELVSWEGETRAKLEEVMRVEGHDPDDGGAVQ
jgi:hypothetical protein